MITPIFDFGFEYELDGKSFSFVVTAASEEEAKARVAAMVAAQCVGKLLSANKGDMASGSK